MPKCVVVIPVHKSNPDIFEIISLQQCYKILKDFDIVILASDGLDMREYQHYVINPTIKFIDAQWFSSIKMYNKLKLSLYFYDLFLEYEYILTYELDAFIFKNELLDWIQKDFDYIGAPWFEGFGSANDIHKFIGVGNSGFSLRNTKRIRNALRKHVYSGIDIRRKGIYHSFKRLLKILPYLVASNRFKDNYTIQTYCNLPEDKLIGLHLKGLRLPDFKDSMNFSFETLPEKLYEFNKSQLPMGCHAWNKYNFYFWKPFIENEGYSFERISMEQNNK